MSTTALPITLSEGTHPVIFHPRQDDAHEELKAEVDRKYVHMKFTETRGGTELGFPLDDERSDLGAADWENHTGEVHLEGELKLDGMSVRCVVDLDLATLEGTGHLDLL